MVVEVRDRDIDFQHYGPPKYARQSAVLDGSTKSSPIAEDQSDEHLTGRDLIAARRWNALESREAQYFFWSRIIRHQTLGNQ